MSPEPFREPFLSRCLFCVLIGLCVLATARLVQPFVPKRLSLPAELRAQGDGRQIAVVCYISPCGCETYSRRWLAASIANPKFKTVVLSAIENSDFNKLKAIYQPKNVLMLVSKDKKLLETLAPQQQTTLTLLRGDIVQRQFTHDSRTDSTTAIDALKP